MPEIKSADNSWNWICRILFTLDIISLLSGYIGLIQARHQLVSPLIPESLVTRIMTDSRLHESSIGAGVLLLAGLWFYSFNQKKTASILFILSILVHRMLILILSNNYDFL